MNCRFLRRCAGAFVLLLAGCSSSEFEMIAVTGTVTFPGGTVPEAEISQIQFVPLPNIKSGEAGQPRTATGKLQPDGSFELYTFESGDPDGVVPGDYKVILRVWKTYVNQDSLIPAKYEKVNTTPWQRVVSSEQHEFDFTVEAE